MAVSNKTIKISYWVCTLLFILPMIGTAIPELFTASPSSLPVLRHLGYPDYLARILGLAKLLGASSVLFGGSSRIKEWAYAGFSFLYLGAVTSHLFAGDRTQPLLPLTFLAISTASYLLWRNWSKAGAEVR